jgi:MFS family permease
MQLIAASAIILLEAVFVLMAFYIAYFVWLRWKNEDVTQEPLEFGIGFAFASAVFVVLVAASLWGAHQLAEDGAILDSAALLTGCFLAVGALYIGYLRDKWDDDRIRYAVLLWATLWAMIVFLLFVAWRWRDLKPDDSALLQIINNAAQIVGIVIAAAMIVLTNLINSKQQNQTAQHKIYQTLELQSVQLFQWEIEHPKQVEAFWYRKSPPRESIRRYLLKQYVCQMLNLFEMAVRFRRQGIIAPEVFGSWVIWMWEVCNAKVFHQLWASDDALWSNYVVEFREVMSKGVLISRGRGNDEQKRKAFFAFVGKALRCEKVLDWFDNPSRTGKILKS